MIPEAISGHTVTGIVSGAFAECGSQITAIEVPDTVVALGGVAGRGIGRHGLRG